MNRNKTALLVEDDPSVLLVISIILKKNNFEVLSCDTPEKAKTLAQTNAFSIVITDNDLHQKRDAGVELVRFFAEHYPATPVVLMSGLMTKELHEKALNAGAGATFPKPFPPSELADAINTAIEKKAEASLM